MAHGTCGGHREVNKGNLLLGSSNILALSPLLLCLRSHERRQRSGTIEEVYKSKRAPGKRPLVRDAAAAASATSVVSPDGLGSP